MVILLLLNEKSETVKAMAITSFSLSHMLLFENLYLIFESFACLKNVLTYNDWLVCKFQKGEKRRESNTTEKDYQQK